MIQLGYKKSISRTKDMKTGERIRQLRTEIGYSQNKLATRAGISQAHLRKVEMGLSDISVGHLRLVCNALGITMSEFFYDQNTGG